MKKKSVATIAALLIAAEALWLTSGDRGNENGELPPSSSTAEPHREVSIL